MVAAPPVFHSQHIDLFLPRQEFSLTIDVETSTIHRRYEAISQKTKEIHMTSLSVILAEIETSAEKVKGLEADLATERQHGKSLVEQYRAQSDEALKILGIAEN